MDFRFSPEEEAFRAEVRAFLQEHLTEECKAEVESRTGLGPASRAFLRKLGERGWLAMNWPVEFGGQGRPFMERYILMDEMYYFGGPSTLIAVSIVGPCLMMYGTKEQQEKYLPRIASGEILFSLGYTEPEAGSDLASLKLRAVRDGDDYVLKGQKMYSTDSHWADYIWLAARTNPDAPKHRGISLFIVPPKLPGITIQPLYTMSGERTNMIYFEDVRVPKENLVGAENQGWQILGTALALERTHSTGDMRRLLEELIEYARTPRPDGVIPFDDPLVRQRLAQVAMDVRVATTFAHRTAWMQANGMVPNIEASILKLFRSELQVRLGQLGMWLMGQYGQLGPGSKWAQLEGKLERYWRWSFRITVTGGTSEVQRNIIAQRGLGLPRD